MPPLAAARTRAHLACLLASGFLCAAMADTGIAPSTLPLPPLEVSSPPLPLGSPADPLRLDIIRWLPPGRVGSLGISLGMALPTQAGPQPYALPYAHPYATATAPLGTDVGVRWRAPLGNGRHLDMAAWTPAGHRQEHDALGMIWHQHPKGSYGTRVELQWTSSRTGSLIPEFGAIGVQLQDDSRLLLRVRRGGPMLYYRSRF